MRYEQRSQQFARPHTQPTRNRGRGCLSRLFFLGLIGIAFVVFTGVIVTATLVYVRLSDEIEEGVAALDDARDRETFESTRILDRNGALLWEIFGEGKRTRVALDRIPKHLLQATIAVEDDSFYENIGLDAPSLLAAIIYNLRNTESRPIGGSTITQQIVRHIAFDYDERTAVSVNRKTREIILAWMMNRQYSKDEILELYLNEIYYGNLAYGVEAAAQTYFGKSVTDVSLAEASLLAALPQSPVDLDPLVNLEGAKERQWLVLNLMVEEAFITRPEAESAYLESLQFEPQEVNLAAPHFAVYVRQLLEEQFGSEIVANGGLRVTTTLDLRFQELAEESARQHVAEIGAEHNLTNAALVAIKPGTGEILAMLGSVNYRDEAIDGNVNITLTPQQPGSAIKPLTYAAALSPSADGGKPAWTLGDILWDVPVEYPQPDGTVYAPVNYSRTFHGPLRVRTALANSYNVPAVLVLQDIGVARLLEMAQRMGIASLGADASRYGLSLTLGGGEVTPLELTSAYATFAAGGKRVPTSAILRVENTEGEVLFDFQPPPPESALDPRVAFLISDILDDDNARSAAMGADNPLALPFPAAAKTGTTNDFRDNWTVGYTPGIAVGVWTGNADNSAMIDVSGLTGAAPLWAAFMQAVYGAPDLVSVLDVAGASAETTFTAPAGLERRPLCRLDAVIPGARECVPAGEEWFLVDPPASQPTAEELASIVTWEAVDPAVLRAYGAAVPAELATDTLVGSTGPSALPPPQACVVPEGTSAESLPPGLEPSLFLAPPRNQESKPGAYTWADQHGLAVLPWLPCDDALLVVDRGDAAAVWRILSPRDGEAVDGVIPVVGTADFDPKVIQFYKVEIRLREEPEEWVTIGETHDSPVVNGPLETLHADAFTPGNYALRLVVVGQDGNYVGEPDVVTVRIE